MASKALKNKQKELSDRLGGFVMAEVVHPEFETLGDAIRLRGQIIVEEEDYPEEVRGRILDLHNKQAAVVENNIDALAILDREILMATSMAESEEELEEEMAGWEESYPALKV